MKSIIFILGILLSVIPLNAQKIIEKHLGYGQKTKVIIDVQIADSIKINTWNKNEVFAKASVSINEDKDNDAYETSFNDSGTEIRIEAEFKKEYFDKKNNCVNSEISWEIFIPENAVFSVKTISGNIIIAGKTSELKANTISGFVDLTVPKNINADLSCKTITGTIYSNHDFTLTGSKKHHSSDINEKINGGGKSINLETISGDIFFREMK
ncbi:MAG: hypothetical protein U0W24_00220 [Bacteroidales bacterium]